MPAEQIEQIVAYLRDEFRHGRGVGVALCLLTEPITVDGAIERARRAAGIDTDWDGQVIEATPQGVCDWVCSTARILDAADGVRSAQRVVDAIVDCVGAPVSWRIGLPSSSRDRNGELGAALAVGSRRSMAICLVTRLEAGGGR